MQRTFLTNLALVLVLNLLVKPFYILGIDAGVQQAVGAEVYGGYAALLSLSFLLNIVLDLGLTNYSTRHIAQHTQLMGKYVGGVAAVGDVPCPTAGSCWRTPRKLRPDRRHGRRPRTRCREP